MESNLSELFKDELVGALFVLFCFFLLILQVSKELNNNTAVKDDEHTHTGGARFICFYPPLRLGPTLTPHLNIIR